MLCINFSMCELTSLWFRSIQKEFFTWESHVSKCKFQCTNDLLLSFSKQWSETNDVLRTVMFTKKNKKCYMRFLLSQRA